MTLPAKISTLWVVVLLNMIFADILSIFYPGTVAQLSTGTIEGVTITPMFLVLAAVFIEVGIAMIFLTRALAPRASRIANLAAVVVTILFVVGGGSLSPHYIFLASIEVLALLYIGYLAWTWREAEDAAFA
ncbi:DUF6326 family protein [Maritimibacter sp. UBA3975]|uniref:DUF6326 family protein n=1 Tax=Maritimibacter sp. UBA3975 TaxID=1946833 RepID=UPI000C0ABD38|nr:DUF6326 family protein [Maritimibacter sp. UBA3975]MAM63746.1 hypothetical protein [Maritimibacter sp.]|tara:strand:+ start:24195 stop:24587 length:393 start_codon:yes stop_codon:yes gene_type:complete